MSLTMREIDSFIDTTILRLASESGRTTSDFYVDLRAYQQRITQNLVTQCTDICASRGLSAERSGDGLMIHVDLDRCVFTSTQSANYATALAYTRRMHGNHL